MISVHEASQYQDHLNGPIFIPYDRLKSYDFLEAANEVVQEESRAQISEEFNGCTPAVPEIAWHASARLS